MDHRVIVERNGSLVISFVSLDFFFFFFFSFNDFASRIHREPNKRNSFETRNDSPISNTSHFESHAAASWPTLITTSLSFLPRIITRHSFIFLFFFFFFYFSKTSINYTLTFISVSTRLQKRDYRIFLHLSDDSLFRLLYKS